MMEIRPNLHGPTDVAVIRVPSASSCPPIPALCSGCVLPALALAVQLLMLATGSLHTRLSAAESWSSPSKL